MSVVLLLLFAVFMILWICFLWSRRRFYKVYWQLRGPFGLPLIGLGLKMMTPEKFLQYMRDKGEQYKTPFISWMGIKCFLYVNDPQTMETIFNSACCINKGDLYKFMANAIGDGLFTSSSPRWNKHRRLINPSFSRKVIHMFVPIFNREANILINKLLKSEGQPLEIYETIKRSVLETACQTTMGKKRNSHKNGPAAIFEAYNGLTEVCVRRMLSPWLYLNIVYRNSSLFKRQQECINVLYEFVESLLQMREEIKDSTEEPSGNSGNDNDKDESEDYNGENTNIKSRVFIEQIRNNVDLGQLTWEDVRDEANVIVAATYETTSTALYFVCLCLAIHPEYQDKLYNELIEIFPENGSEHPNLNEITLQQLERLTYTEMVINESMRLFAPVPMVLRQASCDFEINDGTLIPEGTQIGIDIFNMQRNKNVWGPYAQTFNPEMHFGESRKPHPFAFIPFTKGIRMCMGYRYALILMKIILAKIFRNFRVDTDARIEDLRIKGTISLKLCQYPLCTLQKREVINVGNINKL